MKPDMFFLMLFILCLTARAATDELKMVIQVTRHGARATVELDPEKNVSEVTWRIGEGELTPIGERQHYVLSQYVRKRYIEEKEFLSSTYNPEEIFVVSTSVNRTMMSAYAEVLGFFE